MHSSQSATHTLIGRAWRALCLLGASDCLIATELHGVAQLFAGDTLIVQGQTVRLAGVLAPTPGQPCFSPEEWPCGDDSLDALARLTDEQAVSCMFSHTNGPLEAYCWLRDVDLNAWMISQGWALAKEDSSPYLEFQARAVTQERGIWAGGFKPTAAWMTWAAEKQPPESSGCSPCSARKQNLTNKRKSAVLSELSE